MPFSSSMTLPPSPSPSPSPAPPSTGLHAPPPRLHQASGMKSPPFPRRRRRGPILQLLHLCQGRAIDATSFSTLRTRAPPHRSRSPADDFFASMWARSDWNGGLSRLIWFGCRSLDMR